MRTNLEVYGDVELIKWSQEAIDQRVEVLNSKLTHELSKNYRYRDQQLVERILKDIKFLNKLNE